MSWLIDLIGEAAFPWVAGCVFGLAVGAWLDWLLRRIERLRLQPDDRSVALEKLGMQSTELSNKILEYKYGSPNERPDIAPILLGEALALRFRYEAEGIPLFKSSKDDSITKKLDKATYFFGCMGPVLRNATIDEIRIAASVFGKNSIIEPPEPQSLPSLEAETPPKILPD
jgi:hypothetical protein